MKSGLRLVALLSVTALGAWVWISSDGPTPEVAPIQASAGDRVIEPEAADSKGSQDPAPIRQPPPTPASAPVAVSSAQNLLTIEGVLRQEFSQKVWGDGNDFKRVQGPGKDLTSTLKSKNLNPDGKVPSEEQARVLVEILDKHTRIIEPLCVSEGKERKRALISAVDAGHFESAVVPVVPMGDLHGQERIRTQVREVVDGMRSRLLGGMSPHDYIFSAVAQTGQDGVGRRSLVYVSRQNDPAYFQVSDALRAAEAARNEELKNYLRGL